MADHPLMTQWIVAFSETIGEPTDVDSAKSSAQQYIEDRQLYIWDDGGPSRSLLKLARLEMGQQSARSTRRRSIAVRDMRPHAFGR